MPSALLFSFILNHASATLVFSSGQSLHGCMVARFLFQATQGCPVAECPMVESRLLCLSAPGFQHAMFKVTAPSVPHSGWGPVFTQDNLGCLCSGPNLSRASHSICGPHVPQLDFNLPTASWGLSCLHLPPCHFSASSLSEIVLCFHMCPQASTSCLLLPAVGNILKLCLHTVPFPFLLLTSLSLTFRCILALHGSLS